jgi:hypothetical protein
MPQAPQFATYTQAQALLRGNAWFVNETTGSDSNGGTQQRPFATLAKAAAVAQSNDTVFFSGTVHLTSTLNWATNDVNLVGINAASNNCRARISSKGATAFSPLVNVTALGCQFVNIGTFHGGFTGATGSQVCWAEAGGRNYYHNCQFLGGGDATTAALAGMRSLTIGGSGENLFESCTVGLDTITRATNANASLEIINASPRNIFRAALFQALCSNAADVHVLVGAAGMDRYALFDSCVFTAGVDSAGTTLNAAISANASAGGSVIVNGGIFVGATAVATTGPVYVNGAVPAATTSSIGIKAT